MTTSTSNPLDLAALSRKELQALAKEFQLCRGNAKSDVILQHVQAFVAANPSDGDARVRAVLGGESSSDAAPAPATPTKAVKSAVASSSATKASPAAATKASPLGAPQKTAGTPKAAKTKKSLEPIVAKKTTPATPESTKKTLEKKAVATPPPIAKPATAAPTKSPVTSKSPVTTKSPVASKSPAKAERTALASLDANVVAVTTKPKTKQSKKAAAAVDALVRSVTELAFVGDGSRVRCSLTGHEMKADADVVSAYVQGKRYQRAKLKRQSFAAFAPMFTAHPDAKKAPRLLWCSVTETEHPRDVARIEAHMAGTRYQKELPQWQEAQAARVKAEREAAERAAVRAKARAEKREQLEAAAAAEAFAAKNAGKKKRKTAAVESKKRKAEVEVETQAAVEHDGVVADAITKRPRKRSRGRK